MVKDARTVLSEIAEVRKDAFGRGEPILREKSYELLLDTIKKKRPERILEIGTNEGLSAVSMMAVSENSFLTGMEIDEERYNVALYNFKKFGMGDRAKIFLGDAREIVPLLTGKYDFIFLDGPKGHYFEFLPYLLSALNVGGILFADNVLYRGYTFSQNVPQKHNTIKHCMENFLTKITTDRNLKTVVFEIEDGVSITEKIR